jgi:hypothetical protein
MTDLLEGISNPSKGQKCGLLEESELRFHVAHWVGKSMLYADDYRIFVF